MVPVKSVDFVSVSPGFGGEGIEPLKPVGLGGAGIDPVKSAGLGGTGIEPVKPAGLGGAGIEPVKPAGLGGAGIEPVGAAEDERGAAQSENGQIAAYSGTSRWQLGHFFINSPHFYRRIEICANRAQSSKKRPCDRTSPKFSISRTRPQSPTRTSKSARNL